MSAVTSECLQKENVSKHADLLLIYCVFGTLEPTFFSWI